MLAINTTTVIILHLAPCDLRLGFQGLHALATVHADKSESQALHIFTNRPRTRIKILTFDGTGLWLHTKRLEQGNFAWPKPAHAEQPTIRLTPQALHLILDGIDLRRATLRPWYQRD